MRTGSQLKKLFKRKKYDNKRACGKNRYIFKYPIFYNKKR